MRHVGSLAKALKSARNLETDKASQSLFINWVLSQKVKGK